MCQKPGTISSGLSPRGDGFAAILPMREESQLCNRDPDDDTGLEFRFKIEKRARYPMSFISCIKRDVHIGPVLPSRDTTLGCDITPQRSVIIKHPHKWRTML